MQTCIIFNPVAKGEKARNFRRHLREMEEECVLKQTRAADDARQLAAEAVEAGCEMIVAAGGDGTLNEVLNGIADVPAGFERASLGILPLGTVNVFARELGIPRRFDQAWQTIQRGHETRIDLPSVEYGSDGARRRRYFAQLGGAGLDARAIELVEWSLKKKIGPLAYVAAGLRALRRPPSKITVTDGKRTAVGELVLLGNGRLYGGQFQIFPRADLRDGLLDVCVFPKVNWLTLARCGPSLLLRGKLPGGATEEFQAPSIHLTSSPPASLEVDGEWVGHLPATWSLKRAGMRVVVP